MSYARGKKAYFIDQKDGLRKPYSDMQSDGQYPGLQVGPDTWDPKHPQETPVVVQDAVGLERPTGDTDRGAHPTIVQVPSPNLLESFEPNLTHRLQLVVGRVTLDIGDLPVCPLYPAEDLYPDWDLYPCPWPTLPDGDPARAPVITSSPVTTAATGVSYTYQVTATDLDITEGYGDVLTFSLNAAPDGMVIDPATGEITWTP